MRCCRSDWPGLCLFCCCMLSANRVYLSSFCFIKFPILLPPPPRRQWHWCWWRRRRLGRKWSERSRRHWGRAGVFLFQKWGGCYHRGWSVHVHSITFGRQSQFRGILNIVLYACKWHTTSLNSLLPTQPGVSLEDKLPNGRKLPQYAAAIGDVQTVGSQVLCLGSQGLCLMLPFSEGDCTRLILLLASRINWLVVFDTSSWLLYKAHTLSAYLSWAKLSALLSPTQCSPPSLLLLTRVCSCPEIGLPELLFIRNIQSSFCGFSDPSRSALLRSSYPWSATVRTCQGGTTLFLRIPLIL